MYKNRCPINDCANNNNMETKVRNEEELLKSVFGINFVTQYIFANIYYYKLRSTYCPAQWT